MMVSGRRAVAPLSQGLPAAKMNGPLDDTVEAFQQLLLDRAGCHGVMGHTRPKRPLLVVPSRTTALRGAVHDGEEAHARLRALRQVVRKVLHEEGHEDVEARLLIRLGVRDAMLWVDHVRQRRRLVEAQSASLKLLAP